MDNIVFIILIIIFFLLSISVTLILDAHQYINKTKFKLLVATLKESHKISKHFDLTSLTKTVILTTKAVLDLFAVAFLVISVSHWSYYYIILIVLGYLIILQITNTLLNAIAKIAAEKIILYTRKYLVIVAIIFYPIVIIIYGFQILFNKLLKTEGSTSVTEDELLEVVDEAMEDGSIDQSESNLIKNVLDFGELKVIDIFTPRVHMVSAAINEDPQKILQLFKKSGYSRMPIYEKNLDNIIGTLNHKDFYNRVLLEHDAINDCIKPPVRVTAYMQLSDLLTLLQTNKSHMAIVKDEFGGTLGLVTMEDILEELVGDIWDEHDEIIERIQVISDDEWNIKGTAEIEDVYDQIGLRLTEDENLEHITISGWVVETLGRMAQIGDQFENNNLLVTVINADNKKVLEVNIKRVIHEDTETDDDTVET